MRTGSERQSEAGGKGWAGQKRTHSRWLKTSIIKSICLGEKSACLEST